MIVDKSLNVLLVEDNENDALLALRELHRGGYEVNSDRVETASAMTKALEQHSWDIILSDYSMPSFSAPEALALVQRMRPDIPFIIVSGTVGEDVAVDAMRAGANDFFSKGKLVRLVPAVERALRDAQERTARQKTERQLGQSEDRFAKVFQANPIGICIAALDDTVIDVNARYCEMFGFQREEVLGHNSLDLGIWVSLDERDQLHTRLRDRQVVHNVEFELQTKTGEIRYCLISCELINVGDQLCDLMMIADITERKLAEKALERNTALIKLLQEATVAANEATELDDTLEFAIKRICEFTNWEIGHVYLLTDSAHPQLSSSVWHRQNLDGFADFRRVSDELRFSEDHNGLVQRAFLTEGPEWTDDVEQGLYSVRATSAAKMDIQAAYAFPVLTRHKVAAILEFFSVRSMEPDQMLFDTIMQIAAQLGRVIERTQASKALSALYNATSYLLKADNLRDLSEQIVNGVVNEFEQVNCGLLLVDRDRDRLVRAARAGAYKVDSDAPLRQSGLGLAPESIREGRLIYTPNVELDADYVPNGLSTKSKLIVPLKSGENVLGVLDLQSDEIDHFSESDQRVLSAFAERAAAALEIMQLVDEINRHATQLELRVAERTWELTQAKERVEAILNSSSDAIILAKANGTIRQTNPRFNHQFGYEDDELFGVNVVDILSEDVTDNLVEALQDVATNKQYRRLEALTRRKDGSKLPVDIALSGFSDKDSTGIVFSLRDISEQKNLENELRAALQKQKELIELKTRFVSMVSHEYRTPLAIILSSSSLLKDYSHRLTEEQKLARLQTIQTQVHRLTELLDEVLQINKAESIQLEFRRETIDFVLFCRDLVNNSQQISPKHQIEFSVSGEPVEVGADIKLLRQIVSNLLSNAIKYSPETSTIWFDIIFGNDQVSLVVKDQGIGIPEEDQEHLFTTYHRARNVGNIQGTGLGLAIMKQAVEAHQGTLSVESRVGTGTTFTIALPI